MGKQPSDAVLQTAHQFQVRDGFFFAFTVLLEHKELPRINLLNSIPSLLSKYVHLSLLSKEVFEIVLNKVAFQQIRALDRLTLAIPIQELLSYYEAQLLHDFLALSHGLMLTMSIPLASRRTVMTTYQALSLPMPQEDDVEAIQ